MGVIDAFVNAHNHHHRNVDNPRNFGDCMEGRIRFMTAITPTYAHAYQSICLAGRPMVISTRNFAYLRPKPNIRIFPILGRQHAKEAMISTVGPLTLMEELAPMMVEP